MHFHRQHSKGGKTQKTIKHEKPKLNLCSTLGFSLLYKGAIVSVRALVFKTFSIPENAIMEKYK